MTALYIAMAVLGLSALVFMGIMLLPHLYARNISRHVLRRGPDDQPWIALTFDDGPDILYTPQVLDILQERQVSAAFFLVTGQALEHPDLVQRMAREGHLVGLHAREHRHPFLYGPMKTARMLRQGKAELEMVLGQACHWYRPPWGGFTLAVLRVCRRLGMTCAYWSFDAQDWRTADPQHIVRMASDRAHPGGIMLLHDRHHLSGDSPQATVQALPQLIDALWSMGYTIVRLDRMMDQGGHKLK